MSLTHSPRIVSDGLIICLDAGNPKSYPGSGTTWYDLSNTRGNATLSGDFSYSSNNGGSIVFDTSEDFSGNFTCNKTYYSLDFWCYPTSVINYNWVIGFNDFWGDFGMHTTNNGEVYVGTSVASRISPWRTNVFVLNTWQNFTWTFDNGLGKFYKNGTLERSQSLSLSSRSEFTTYFSGGGSSACNGRISNLKIYSNKVLTQEEIIQNYNAVKYRFSI